MRLFGLVISRAGSPVEPSAELARVLVRLNDLERRVAALGEEEASREIRLGKLAGDIRRHFKAVQELDRRAQLREREDGDPEDDELDELAQLKLTGRSI